MRPALLALLLGIQVAVAATARAQAPRGGGAGSAGADTALMAAARQATELWMRHDFTGLVGTGEAVMVQLPGAEPSSALRPAQAAALLAGYAAATEELDVQILVARRVEPDRAYVEAQRVFTSAGTPVRHSETLYFGFRLIRGAYHLVEVRALP